MSEQRNAAGPWRTDDPPKDGRMVLLQVAQLCFVAHYDARVNMWLVQVGHEGKAYGYIKPTAWAELYMPEEASE